MAGANYNRNLINRSSGSLIYGDGPTYCKGITGPALEAAAVIWQASGDPTDAFMFQCAEVVFLRRGGLVIEPAGQTTTTPPPGDACEPLVIGPAEVVAMSTDRPRRKRRKT